MSNTEITSLPFVADNISFGKDLWKVPAGAPIEHATGRQYADAAVAHARAAEDPMFLGSVLREIVRKHALGPIEIGFMQRIGEHAMLSESIAVRPASALSEV